MSDETRATNIPSEVPDRVDFSADAKSVRKVEADYDVAIVGASLAGCSAAILLARTGARVALIEKSPDPKAFKRVCSHYIQSSGVRPLERIGLLEPMMRAGAVRSRGYAWTRWGWVEPRPDSPLPSGINLRRERLDPLIRENGCREAWHGVDPWSHRPRADARGRAGVGADRTPPARADTATARAVDPLWGVGLWVCLAILGMARRQRRSSFERSRVFRARTQALSPPSFPWAERSHPRNPGLCDRSQDQPRRATVLLGGKLRRAHSEGVRGLRLAAHRPSTDACHRDPIRTACQRAPFDLPQRKRSS